MGSGTAWPSAKEMERHSVRTFAAVVFACAVTGASTTSSVTIGWVTGEGYVRRGGGNTIIAEQSVHGRPSLLGDVSTGSQVVKTGRLEAGRSGHSSVSGGAVAATGGFLAAFPEQGPAYSTPARIAQTRQTENVRICFVVLSRTAFYSEVVADG